MRKELPSAFYLPPLSGLVWGQGAGEYALIMLSRARSRGWENKIEQNWNPHLWNWVIVSAVTDNVEGKKIGLCHIWAAMWYGWIGSLLIQDLHFTANVASTKPSPVWLHVVNSSQRIPTHSFFLQDQFNSYLFLVFIAPSILWVSKGNCLFVQWRYMPFDGRDYACFSSL